MSWWGFGIAWALCLIARIGIEFGIQQVVDDKKDRELLGCLIFPFTFSLTIVRLVLGVGFAYLLLQQWGWL